MKLSITIACLLALAATAINADDLPAVVGVWIVPKSSTEPTTEATTEAITETTTEAITETTTEAITETTTEAINETTTEAITETTTEAITETTTEAITETTTEAITETTTEAITETTTEAITETTTEAITETTTEAINETTTEAITETTTEAITETTTEAITETTTEAITETTTEAITETTTEAITETTTEAITETTTEAITETTTEAITETTTEAITETTTEAITETTTEAITETTTEAITETTTEAITETTTEAITETTTEAITETTTEAITETTTEAITETTTEAITETTTEAITETTTEAITETTTEAITETTTEAIIEAITEAPIAAQGVVAKDSVEKNKYDEDVVKEIRRHHPRFPEVILHRRKTRHVVPADDEVKTLKCTGTMVSSKFLLTSKLCATSVQAEGMDAMVSKQNTEASATIQVKTIALQDPLALLEVADQSVPNHLLWAEKATEENVNCVFNYLKPQVASREGSQVSENVTVVACKEGVTKMVCIAPPTEEAYNFADICQANLEGGVLVCDNLVVGIYSKAVKDSCKDDLIMFYDVKDHKDWIWSKTSGAAGQATFGALVAAMVIAVAAVLN